MSLGVKVYWVDLSPDYDIERGFKTAKTPKSWAIATLASAALYVRSKQIGAMALKNKIPTIGSYRDLVDDGGFTCYSTDIKDGFYRAAYFVDRLLKGAKAPDLPFEQSAHIKLFVNVRTAEGIGMKVWQSIYCAPTR